MTVFYKAILTLLLVIPFSVSATNLLYGPWVQNVGENGFTVIWVTEKPSLDYVEVAPADGLPFESVERAKYYQSSNGRRITRRYHSVRIDNLEPGTEYRYRIVGEVIKDGSNPYHMVLEPLTQLSERIHSVKTLDASAEICRFTMFNDMHGDDARFKALAAGVEPEKTDFIVLNGDIISYVNEIDTLVRHTVQPIANLTDQLPLFYARGNHETRGSDFDKVYDLFPTSTGEFYYTFRQGPAAFVVLDAGEDKPDDHPEYSGTADYQAYRMQQTEWLKEAIKEPAFQSAPVKICIMHIPTIAHEGCWYTVRWVTENWGPILEEAGIDLLLGGHYHRWIFSEAGQDGKNYPAVANTNLERLDVVVTPSGIEFTTYSTDGTPVHHWKNN